MKVPLPARETLACDFDGVVYNNTRGWQGGLIYGDPMPGTEDALRQLSARYRLVLFTARHNLDEVRSWLRQHGLGAFFSDVTNRKPQAVAYLDDRAVPFIDWAQALKDLL